MTKKNQNFDMYAGDTEPLNFTMSDGTSLSGATIKWVLKKSVSGQQLVLKTTPSDITISGTTFAVSLNAADTAGLSGRYYHAAQVTDVSGKIFTIAVGNMTIEPSGV